MALARRGMARRGTTLSGTAALLCRAVPPGTRAAVPPGSDAVADATPATRRRRECVATAVRRCKDMLQLR